MNALYKAVLIQFELSGKHYSYLTDIPDLEPNDRVVLVANGAFKVARVMKTLGLTKNQTERAESLIYAKIDREAYAIRVRQHNTYIEIKNELRVAKEQHDEMFIYETLAKDNPRIKELLTQMSEMIPATSSLLPPKTDG